MLTRWKLVTETEALHPGFDDVIYREAEAPPQVCPYPLCFLLLFFSWSLYP